VVSSAGEQPTRYRRVVDGLVLPVAIATHPALDFCNTLAGWNEPEPHDYLATYTHLVVWARETGLVDARSTTRALNGADDDPRGATRQLERARSLRSALHAACTDSRSDAAWDAVAAEARAAASQAVLRRDGAPGRRWSISPAVGLERPVLELAREAADLLAGTDLRHVRACPGTHCGWLFVDPSGRRRWCTMEVCGNRAKVRRHAERQRAARAVDRRAG
jgi:predicted RNA-binding Zn ribbon-like protein